MTNPQPSATEEPHAALVALNARVDELVETAGADRWNTETPAEGWDIAMQIAHLAWTDEVSLTAIRDAGAFQAVVEKAMEDPTGFVDVGAAEIAAIPDGNATQGASSSIPSCASTASHVGIDMRP